MMDQLNRLDTKLDKMAERATLQEVQLARIVERLDSYNELLREHIRRTDLAEQRLDELYRYKWLAVGAVAVITFIVQLLGKAILK